MVRVEYCITDGQKYIRQNIDGKYVQTNNLSLANTYSEKKTALNVLLNSIPKVWSRSFYVAKIENGEIVKSSVPRPPKTIKKKSEFVFTSHTAKEKQWYEKFLGIDELFDYAAKRNNEISQELSDIEAKLVDMEHYIEFTSLNACGGYLVYKELHKILNERRKLKNEQKVVMAINKNQEASEAVKKIIQAVKTETGHEYKPRLLIDLFENGLNGLCTHEKDVV